MAAKAKGGPAWTKELQDELTEVTETLVDVEEAYKEKLASIEENPAPEKTTEETTEKLAYKVPKGTEKLVHVRLIKGSRYNPHTGKLMTKPYMQMFNFGEWQLFKSNFQKLGYRIIEVLHDPYGDAAALATPLE